MELEERERQVEEVRQGMRGAMAAQLAAAQAAHQEVSSMFLPPAAAAW